MAKSDWDTLAVDLASKSCGGSMTTLDGIMVEIWKNWIYVRDPAAWREGSFTDGVVMEIKSGTVRYRNVEIEARRGPRNGVYVVVMWKDDDYKIAGAMVGCGVYGYGEGEGEFEGVTPECVAFLRAMLDDHEKMTDDQAREYVMSMWFSNDQAPSESYVQERMTNYMEPSYAFDEIIRRIDLDDATRENQGDRYFADNLGLGDISTPVGEQAPTIMQKVVDSWKADGPTEDAS